MRKNAFTMSEVLLSLLVIGIILILTVPNVVVNVEKRTYAAQLGTVFKSVDTAVTNMMLDERVSSLSNSSLFSEDNYNFFNTYLNASRVCGTSFDGCFAENYSSISGEDVDVSDFLLSDENFSYYITLPSGASLGFFKPDAADEGVFIVDVNNTDAPNIIGEDFFAFKIDNEGTAGFETYGEYDSDEDRITDCKDGVNYGIPCFSQIKSDNWEIQY